MVSLQCHVKCGQLPTNFLPCAFLLPGLHATSISNSSPTVTALIALLKFLHCQPLLCNRTCIIFRDS